MDLKLIGSGILLIAAWRFSELLNEKERRRLERLEGFVALLRFFRLQIDCYCVPVGEIFRRCDIKVLSACGCTEVPKDFEGFISHIPMPEEEASLLLGSFCAELGSSYREEQLKSCDYHIMKFCELRDRAAERVKKQKRLNTTLCITAAATAVILLL